MKYLMISLMFFLFLVSCAVEKPLSGTDDILLSNDSLESVPSTVSSDTSETLNEASPASCVPGWKCISSKTKMFQEENCSLSKKQECKYGCKNDSCNPPPTCTTGIVCAGDYARGFRLESCDFQWKEKCEFGCQEGKCLAAPLPENKTTEAVAEKEEEAVKPAFSSLSLGEIVSIDASGSLHNLSIYTMTMDQVMIMIDGKKSDWLEEGGSYSRNGVTVIVEEILFQSYQNGKKMISYTLK